MLRARSGSGGWTGIASGGGSDRRHVLLSPEDLNEPWAAAEGVEVAGARRIAVGLIGGPLASDVGAAPALVAILDTGVLVEAAVACLPAFGDTQIWVAVGVEIDVEDGQLRVLDIAAHISPCRRRRAKGGGGIGRASSAQSRGRRLSLVYFRPCNDAV